MSSYVIVDLEMCNVPQENRHEPHGCSNEVIQIGAVALDANLEICNTYMSYVKPELGVLDENIIDLTGITEKDLEGAPLFETALCDFLAWLPEDAVLVSWSGSDECQVRKEAKAKNIENPRLKKLLKEWIDCQKTFGDIMYSSNSYGLVNALNVSSINYDEHIHDALVDAKNTALLFAKIEREKNTGFKLNPHVTIGKGESLAYTPFAKLLKNFNAEN